MRRFEASPAHSEQQQEAEAAILREMKERDYRDRHGPSHRFNLPRTPSSLDSTAMTLEEVLAKAEEIVRSHLQEKLDR